MKSESLNECLLKERRRYALLEAAATLQAGAMANPSGDYSTPCDHVDAAVALLTEIEKREAASENR